MTMILIHHFQLYAFTVPSSPQIYILTSLYFYCGVNLFFMISGWYGISLSIKGLTKIIGTVFLFSMVNYCLCLICGIEVRLVKFIKYCMFPISECQYWFLKVYVVLMLVAPLVNEGLKTLSLSKLRALMLLFTFYTVYSGGLGHVSTNADGYTFTNALYLYSLAAYLRRDSNLMAKFNKNMCLAAYFLILLLTSISWWKISFTSIMLDYNGLPIIAATVAFFIFFSKLDFRNRIVNYVASAALGCYLLQDGIWGHSFFYNYLHNIYITQPLSMSLSIFAGVFMATWIGSIMLTIPFNYILKRVSSFIYRLFENLRPRLNPIIG